MSDQYNPANDAILSYRFHVEIEGIVEGMFLECSGLGAKRKVFKYNEGGNNEFVHMLPDKVSYTNVKLKRGMGSTELFDWFQQGLEEGTTQYVNMSILTFAHAGNGIDVVQQWDLERCFPVKWTAASFKTSSSRHAIETLEIAHHGIRQAR
jgi:phage tail-like protein